MGRPGLMKHRKFARLARLLGSDALARGHLEILWDVAYENGDDLLGDALDVEALARWQGKRGGLLRALLSSGFVEEADADGHYRVHDLWDHAPKYVANRAQREAARRERGETLSEVRARAGRLGGKRRAEKMQATVKQTGSTCQANGPTPAPAPAPAPGETSSSPYPIPVATEPDVRTPEGLYAVLFKADPAWTPVRRRLTTTQAGALDAEALRFCGEVLAAGGSGALLAYDPRERARAIIERHGREAREHDDRARRAR